MGNLDTVGYVGDGFIICRDCAEKSDPPILREPVSDEADTHYYDDKEYYPRINGEMAIINPSDYTSYSYYDASTQLGEMMHEATHYSGPRHGDWRVNFDSCDVCCKPLLGWGEIEEAQKEVDGTHWKHDRQALVQRLRDGWHAEQVAALQAWRDGKPTDGHVKRSEQYSRVIDKAQELISDAPSW
jgi:hypothetical protein